MPACPALLVAAPASGQGKTTVVAALARLHSRQGRKVKVFKCGPDFLDPQIHRMASGQDCDNIDFRMAGEDDARWRLAQAATENDLILVEGVMGLHDGEPSAATLARQLGLPILLVQDASAMAGSFGAVAFGLKHYREDCGGGAPIAAVLANRVGSDYHARLCRNTLDEADMAWFGHLPRDLEAALPERHLGLLPAAEIEGLRERLDRMADLLAATPAAALPPAVEFPPAAAPQLPPLLAGKTIAVASDAAFCFAYPANRQCLEAMGATLVDFSPLADKALPACDGVWLPGGYPELHTAAIAANRSMAEALKRHGAAGKPLLAECGGMMALFQTLAGVDGEISPAFGLLPGQTRMQKKLAALGMMAADLPEGRLQGHSFHYSTCHTPLTPLARATKLSGGSPGEAIYRQDRITASYVHFYFAASPEAAARLFL